MSEPFGFEVGHQDADPSEGRAEGWWVRLPHQCAHWDIAGAEFGEPATQAEAVAELERFVTEAQDALAALREGRTVYHDDPLEVDW